MCAQSGTHNFMMLGAHLHNRNFVSKDDFLLPTSHNYLKYTVSMIIWNEGRCLPRHSDRVDSLILNSILSIRLWPTSPIDLCDSLNSLRLRSDGWHVEVVTVRVALISIVLRYLLENMNRKVALISHRAQSDQKALHVFFCGKRAANLFFRRVIKQSQKWVTVKKFMAQLK